MSLAQKGKVTFVQNTSYVTNK